MDKIHRILDANFNRSLEALRVVEDYCRFVKGNKGLSLSLKGVRHRFIGIDLPYLDRWRVSRAVDADPAKFNDISSQKNSEDVVKSNLSRLKESLRTMEEYLKTVSVRKSAMVRSLRFRVYGFEKDVLSCKNGRIKNAMLYIILSTDIFGSVSKFMRVSRLVIEGRPDLVQLRDKKLPDLEKLNILKKLKKFCADNSVPLIVNDRADLCLATDADGVHVGNDDLTVESCRDILGDGKIIGKTVHSLREIIVAGREDVDYISYGTFFESSTKKRKTLNRGRWKHAKNSKKPVFAVGGIDRNKVPVLKQHGFKKIAICSSIMLAKNPTSAVRSFKRLLKT